MSSKTHSDEWAIALLPHDVVPSNTRMVRLRNRHTAAPLLLNVEITFHVDELPTRVARRSFRARVTRYEYVLFDADQRELLAFHWHPSGFSRFRTPHLHVTGATPIVLASATTESARPSLDIGKAHLPTQHVPLEDVVEMLIVDPVFGVEPRRADWRQVLATNRAALDAR